MLNFTRSLCGNAVRAHRIYIGKAMVGCILQHHHGHNADRLYFPRASSSWTSINCVCQLSWQTNINLPRLLDEQYLRLIGLVAKRLTTAVHQEYNLYVILLMNRCNGQFYDRVIYEIHLTQIIFSFLHDSTPFHGRRWSTDRSVDRRRPWNVTDW